MMVGRGSSFFRMASRRSQMENYLRPVFGVLCLVFLFMFANVPECPAQSFGKNKVTERHFDWLTYKTSHFTIYYYPSEERLVRTMADTAEMAYAKISSILEHWIGRA